MRLVLAILISIFFITSCNNKPQQAADKQKPQDAVSNLSSTQTQELTDILYKYYTLKNALVEDDTKLADESADVLSKASLKLKGTFDEDTSRNYSELSNLLTNISNKSIELTTIQDPTTEKKRIVFEDISDYVYSLIKKAEISNITVYRQYCPMAFNDAGAYWLSSNEEILNPYFGHKMPECGEIAEVIK